MPEGPEMLSIVIPVFNEEEIIEELHSRLVGLFDHLTPCRVEVVLVSDGSTDGSNDIIRRICASDPRFKAIFFSRNFGHQAAVSAGLIHASGDMVAIMDADLQDPPELIAEMVTEIRAGTDVVYGVRRKRKEDIMRRLCYWGFYRILGLVSNISIPMDAGDFCCMKKDVVTAINSQPENHRFVRGLRSWVGFRHKGIEYQRSGRFAGTTKYSFKALVKLAYSGIFGFSSLPIKIVQFLGLAFSSIALLVAVLYFFLAVAVDNPKGFSSLMISIWFLSGIHLFSAGIIGEYVYRAYEQTLKRSDYIIDTTIGLNTK